MGGGKELGDTSLMGELEPPSHKSTPTLSKLQQGEGLKKPTTQRHTN